MLSEGYTLDGDAEAGGSKQLVGGRAKILINHSTASHGALRATR
jgi:hypothetical protein